MRKGRFVQQPDRNAITHRAVRLDFQFRARGQCGAARGVVDHLPHLREINRVGIPYVKVGDRAIGHHIRCLATFRDDALYARFGAQVATQCVDVVEQMPHRRQRVATVPRRHLMRGCAAERELHAVDVETATAKSRGSTL